MLSGPLRDSAARTGELTDPASGLSCSDINVCVCVCNRSPIRFRRVPSVMWPSWRTMSSVMFASS